MSSIDLDLKTDDISKSFRLKEKSETLKRW